jgi:DNA-binding transcriptional ArsR family regulator
MSNQSTVDAVFDALGEPVRRKILEQLQAGPLPVGELSRKLPVGRPAVSKHLHVLSQAGLVRHDRQGTRNLYALAPPGLATAQQWLLQIWDTALTRYAAVVQQVVEGDGPVARVPPPSRGRCPGSAP